MRQLSVTRLIVKRLADDWQLLLSVFIGITIATTLAAGTPVYLASLEQLSFHSSLDRLPAQVLDISVSAPDIPLTRRSLQEAEQSLEQAIDRHISPVVLGRERYLRGGNSLVGLPQAPLPEGGGTGVLLSRGYVQLLSNVELHSRFLDGRMAGNDVISGDRGPELEAVVSAATAQRLGLAVGDVVELTPALGATLVISAHVVGVLEPDDPASEYWAAAEVFLDPPPIPDAPPLLVQIDPTEPPVGLFVTGQAIAQVISEPSVAVPFGQEAYFRGDVLLAGLPARPLPLGGGDGVLVPLGYLQHLSNLQDHATFTQGRMAGSTVSTGPRGPMMEAVVSSRNARTLGVSVGDVVTVSPTLGAATVISVEVTGLFEAADLDDAFWTSVRVFLQSSPLSDNIPVLVQEDPDQTPLGLFVTQEAMVEAAARAQPGALVKPLWSVLVDKERLKGWSVSEARARFKALGDEILEAMPGAAVTTGVVQSLTEVGERRSLFSRVPLLLMLAITVATVLVFLSMMVSYLAQSRQWDTALLRTRGVGSMQILRLYAVEGLAMSAAAVVVAPFLAIVVVAVAGLLPFFSELTGGGLMPVRIGPTPFIVASGAGLLSLVIFVAPSVVGARGGLLAQRLLSARPPSVPFFHRYHLDLGLLVVGGLVFWELSQRDQLVTGGPFKDVEVNEALLLAPVLFLIVVALLFVRFFPLVVRYISGESRALVHLLAAASVLTLAAGIVWRDVRADDTGLSLGAVALVLAVGALYWATAGSQDRVVRLGGLAVEAGLIAGFVALEPLDSEEVLFAPALGLMAVVPAQLVFIVLSALTRVSPVWLLMGLRHMSRNPMEYTWLMLLLVLVMGLGVLATTVGGTLERSQTERVQYDVAGDVRVSVVSRTLGGPKVATDAFVDIPGVRAVSAALRGTAVLGPVSAQLLAVEPDAFADISWYRDDFSDRPLSEVMDDLRPEVTTAAIPVPAEATALGLWVKPQDFYPSMSMYIGVEDTEGALGTVILGPVGLPEWTLMQGEIPTDLKPPLKLVTVEVFEPGLSAIAGQGTPGRLLVDDIHVASGGDGQPVLEDFEGELRWSPIVTSAQSTDGIAPVTEDAFRGSGAAALSLGSRTARGFRGSYLDPTAGPLPVVASTSLLAATGHQVGDSVLAQLEGRWVPVVIKSSVDLFPTLDPAGGGFLLADFDSLLSHTNVLLDFFSSRPNEVFVSDTPDSHEAVLEAADRLGEVRDGTEQLESIRRDPYVTAGWRPMVFLSPGVGVVASGVGYVTFLLLFARRRWNEIGSMRSLGLSRAQLTGLLGFEQLAVAAVGLGLGAWSGFQMSRLMVSPLAVTETGDPVVPGFILTTDWSLAAPLFAALVVVLVAALFALNRGAGRLDLYMMTRDRA